MKIAPAAVLRLAALPAALGLALAVPAAARADLPGTVERAFSDAYEAVRVGARETARAGTRVFERTREGAVRVYDEAVRGARHAPRVVADGAITTAVKAKLGASRDVRAGSIDVDTRDGVVTLEGAVRSRYEAERAISIALTTEGVRAVEPRMTWPGQAAPTSGRPRP